jgi:hypothetical protein
MDAADALGLAAGAMQALAYLIYLRQVVAGECRPNGMTWLLWTVGTLVFLAIEADIGAPVSVLLLPAVCALCSLWLAVRCFVRASYIAPEPQDRTILALDAAILAGYGALVYGPFAVPSGSAAGLVFVMLPGISSVVAGWPIVRTTSIDPGNERPLAWFVWSAAYTLVALAAIAEGLSWPYLAYPAMNLGLHLVIGALAMRRLDSPARPAAGPGGVARAGGE